MKKFEKYITYESDVKDFLSDIVEEVSTLSSEKYASLSNEFLKVKEMSIDLVEDLKDIKGEYCFVEKKVIYAIVGIWFELNNINKLSAKVINELYIKHLRKLNDLCLDCDFKEYIAVLPKSSRVSTFYDLTRKPKQDSIEFYRKKGLATWEITDSEYWKFLRFLWLDHSDNIDKSSETWTKLFLCARENKNYFMNEDEQKYFSELPKEFTVFRGYYITKKHKNIAKEKSNLIWIPGFQDIGFSYTLSKEIGVKYYKKYEIYNTIYPYPSDYGTENHLFERIVKKEDVFGYIDQKNEQEVLIIKVDGFYTF